jgi:hypothetical protein
MSTNEDLVARLDVLIRLTALSICGDQTQRAKIALLGSAGMQPKEIAELLGTTPNTVSVALAGIRRERGTSRKAIPKQEKS